MKGVEKKSLKGNSVDINTFKRWGENFTNNIGVKRTTKDGKSLVTEVCCKLCAKFKDKHL